MSEDTHGRSRGGDRRQAPGGSSSDESGAAAAAAAAAAARGPRLPARRRATSAWTSGRGPGDEERPQLPPLPPPLTDRANEADKENQHRSGIVPARTRNRPAGLALAQRDAAGPANPNTRVVAIGRAEAAGQPGREGPANQPRGRLAPTRPTAQAMGDVSGALTALGIRTEARRTGARQRMGTDENSMQGFPTRLQALVERLQLLYHVVEDANKHSENASEAALTAMTRNNAMSEELRLLQPAERDRIDAVAWRIKEQIQRETTRAGEQNYRAVAEAQEVSTVFWQVSDQVLHHVELAQNETTQMAAGQFVATASPSIAPVIAELRTASVQVAAHEAAARAAADQAQQAAQAAEALIEQVRRIMGVLRLQGRVH